MVVDGIGEVNLEATLAYVAALWALGLQLSSLGRTAVQLLISGCDLTAKFMPSLGAFCNSFAGFLEGVDEFLRMFGGKSLQGSGRAVKRVLGMSE